MQSIQRHLSSQCSRSSPSPPKSELSTHHDSIQPEEWEETASQDKYFYQVATLIYTRSNRVHTRRNNTDWSWRQRWRGTKSCKSQDPKTRTRWKSIYISERKPKVLFCSLPTLKSYSHWIPVELHHRSSYWARLVEQLRTAQLWSPGFPQLVLHNYPLGLPRQRQDLLLQRNNSVSRQSEEVKSRHLSNGYKLSQTIPFWWLYTLRFPRNEIGHWDGLLHRKCHFPWALDFSGTPFRLTILAQGESLMGTETNCIRLLSCK